MLQSIVNWFPNHSKTRRNVKIPGFTGKVTFTDVLVDVKKDAIAEKAVELAQGAAPGSTVWLARYREAMRDIRVGLTKEEKQEIVKIQEERERRGVPPEIQAQ